MTRTVGGQEITVSQGQVLQIEDSIFNLQKLASAAMFHLRDLADTIERAARSFPVVLVTGPRQSGKTTLLRQRFGGTHDYVTLENPDARERARRDPMAFLKRHAPPLVLDEIQLVPELLSYVKSMVDEDRKPGRFILSGSQAFALMQGVSQSLAGRVAVLTLLPLSVGEIAGRVRGAKEHDPVPTAWINGTIEPGKRIALARWLWRGGYPERWFARNVDQELWATSYVQTYLERDVRSLLAVRDLGAFQVFLRLAAARTGQVLNLSDLARDAGISHPTARQWLSVLEASHQIVLLRPHFENLGKRLVKAPKLYWLDTGVVASLVGLDERTVTTHAMAGALFETAVVAEFIKAHHHRGREPRLWYWRSSDGWEVDLLLERGGELHPIEIKISATPRPLHADALDRWRRATGREKTRGFVVCDIDRPESLVPGVTAMPWDLL